ncbi:hypothetical protein ABN763_09165 [Spongiivirga sp. MCCC 1A20706]|uniref:hypothetical protein n=1 Tax=Spongiivirga sp. MCCC 1A20706 TaxID=3160963 RepID=UPI0039777200
MLTPNVISLCCDHGVICVDFSEEEESQESNIEHECDDIVLYHDTDSEFPLSLEVDMFNLHQNKTKDTIYFDICIPPPESYS